MSLLRAISASVQLLLLLLLSSSVQLPRGSVEAAAIICGNGGSPAAKNSPAAVTDADGGATVTVTSKPAGIAASEVNHFLERVQCTLEKAKPWVEEFEKDVIRFEESAKRVGSRIISRFSDLFETLLGHRPSVQIRPVLDVNEDKLDNDADTDTATNNDNITVTINDADSTTAAVAAPDANAGGQSHGSASTTTERPSSTVQHLVPLADTANIADNEIAVDVDADP